MNGIWAMGQAMFTKCVIVVDEDCDVQDLREVTLRVANNIDPERDIQFTLGPVDSLDHASRLPDFGSKMGIDATRKWAAEGFTRPWPAMLAMPGRGEAEGREGVQRSGARMRALIVVLMVAAFVGRTEGQELKRFDPKTSYSIFAEYSNDSSRIMIGASQNRRLLAAGMDLSRRLAGRPMFSWRYSARGNTA